MDSGDWIAVAAAVISAVALWFTARSSSVMVKSLSAADRSAAASEASALAAGESVEIAREVRHREDAPTFDVTAAPPHQGRFPIRIKVLTAGPPSIVVTAVCIGETFAAPDANGVRHGSLTHCEGASRGELIDGEDFYLYAQGVADAASGDFKVYLLSKEPTDEPRQWHRVMRVQWPPATA